MRSAIALLLLAATAIGGCDKQSGPAQQANETAAARADASTPPAAAVELDRSHKGEAAPATPFLSPTGAKVTLADFRGKPVLLNLWATWCAPCIKEMPTLDALAVREGEAMQVVTLSQDDTENAGKVAEFFDRAKFKRLQPWRDPEIAFSMGMGVNLPATILYDSQGREVWRKIGETDWAGDAAAKLIAEAR